ncbi:MAG: GNAT family N-acetyltransferase [Thermoplasmata archaeon]
MPTGASPPHDVDSALREERELVLSLGGYALELAGGVLVANERIPVPRFNFIQYVRLHRNRQSAFLERALDHYFQRALRPSIRAERPVPDFLDASLRHLGFRLTQHPWSLLLQRRPLRPHAAASAYEVRTATAEELPLLAGFWTGATEREEFLRALAVTLEHPNPEECLVPGVALRDGSPASAALLHSHGASVGIHGVVTQPSERGRGAATALVAGLLNVPQARGRAGPVAMWSDNPRLDRRLGELGFEVAVRYSVYELPADAELAVSSPAPPAPPRWRPPSRRGEPGA